MDRSTMRTLVVFLVLVSFIFSSSHGAKKKKREVEIEIVTESDDCSEFAEDGDTLTVAYTGMIEATGQVFDSSNGKEPFTFVLGAKQVISGWDIGLKGMCLGERRTITLPPEYGYGKRGSPPLIPPNAKLIFETQLRALKKQTYEEKILPHIKFISVPIAVGLFMYYLYDKVKKAPSEKDVKKAEKKASKKKR
ncbi:peptidyl-prolyl cis-trans isomerase FKBP1A-like [Glandiceps talaboti]